MAIPKTSKNSPFYHGSKDYEIGSGLASFNNNPGNIMYYQVHTTGPKQGQIIMKGGKPKISGYAQNLIDKGFKIEPGAANNHGVFIKFENPADGLRAKSMWWNTVKDWQAYKGKTLDEALLAYSGGGYDSKNYYKNGKATGSSPMADLNLNGNKLLSDYSTTELDSISVSQLATEDSTNYKKLKEQGLISYDQQTGFSFINVKDDKKDDVSPTPIQEPISLESSITSPQVVTPEIIDPAEPVVPGLPTKDEWISNKVKKEQQEKTDLENNKKQVDDTGNTIDDEIEEVEQEDKKLEVISEPIEEVIEEPIEEVIEEPVEEVIEEPVEEVIEEEIEEELIEPKRKDYKSASDFMQARMDYFSKLEEEKEAETVEESEEVFDTGTSPEVTVSGGEAGDSIKPLPPQEMPVEKEEMKPITSSEIVVEEEKETDLVVVNDRGEENIITIPNLIPSIQDNTGQHDHSLPFQPSPMQVAEESFDMSLQREEGYGNPYTREGEQLEGGFGKSSLSNENLQKYFSLKTSKEKEAFLKTKEKEQQEWEFRGGDTYATNIEYVNDTEKLQSTNTINLLKEKYPNLDFSNIANKQDWIKLAMTPKNQGGLGHAIGGDSETEWNSIKNQFSTEGDDFNNTKLEIELANGVWDYIITDNVSGEKKDYGEDEELIKKEALNLIPRSDWYYYHNLEETELGQTAQTVKGRAGQRLAHKESILQQARTKVFGKKLESLNSQGDQIVLDGDVFDKAYKSLGNRVNNFTQEKQSLQEEINTLKDKYGAWKRNAAGALYYDQQDIMSDYDKDRLATINATMSDLEGERKLIVAKQAGLTTEQTRINKQRGAWNEQFEDLTARYNWSIVDQQFDPAFRATREYMKWNESIKNNYGNTADVMTTFTEEMVRMRVLLAAINPATLKAAGIATLATLGLDKTASLWEDKVYQFAPHDINEYNSGYSHTGMMWDMLADVAGFDLLPTSQDESGKIIQHSKFLEDKKDYSSWGAEFYDKIAPGWAGGKGNWSAYSTSKSVAQSLPYMINIMQAYRGMGALSSKMKSTKGLWDGRSKMAKEWGVNKGIGKKIISALNKDFVASEKMLGRLNMVRINHKLTFFDNYADGRARGLDLADAQAYGNFLSLATGISQAIMPDYNWLKSTAGIKITKTLAENLKSAKLKAVGKEISEIAAREANRAAFKTAGLNFLKEHLEEEVDVFFHDVVKSAYLANHSAEISDVNVQAEVLSATTTLMIPVGSISAIRTRNNVRDRVYRVFKNQGSEVIRNGELEIKMLQDRINQTGNTKKDKILRDELIKEQTLLEENVGQARKIVRAINLSPKNVTDTQIDLLVRKQQLLERKSELNKKDKSLYSEEIEKINNDIKSIDVEIKENSIGNYENKLYKNLLKSAKRLEPALGFTLKHNKVDEETFRISIEKEKQNIATHNARIREEIENVRKSDKNKKQKAKEIKSLEKQIKVDNLNYDSPGIIKYDHNGKGNHHIIINEASAKWTGNTGVVLHELLHVMLKRTLGEKPQMLKGLAWMLKRELLKNPEKYKHSGYVVSLKGDRETGGKFDQYKFEKSVNSMAFDEMFTVFLEALAQGNISIKSNVLTKINDVFRRMFRANGINFNIKGHKGMINFLRDFQKEMENGRFRFNEKTGQEELSEGMMKIFKEGLPLDIDRGAVEAANQWEARMIAEYNIDKWRPEEERVAKSIIGKTSRSNVYKTEKIKEDLELTEGTKKIVEENERIRKLILEEGIKKDGKIVASEDLQTKLVENNLPLAISLGTFAAQNPKIMGLEEDKKITREQFISGYYLELSKLAKTYDASVNEFGQYLNTILPIRYGNILEAEKKGAIQGARVEFDYVPDAPIDDDVSTPDDVDTRPKIDTAERLEVKDKTKPFIDKTLKQLKKLENLKVKLSEKQDEKAEEEIAKLTSDLESKGALDLDVESLTVKQAPNLLYKTVAKIFGIDEDKLNPNSNSWLANLRKKEGKRGSNEVRSAQRAVAKHAQLILSTIFNEGHTAAFKSSGMPNTLLKFGYTKGSKRIGNNFPQYKKPNLSEADLLKFVGIEKIVKNGVTAFNFNVDRNTSAKLLAIAQMVDRNMSLQGINEYLEETGDLTPKIKNAIEDGMSKSSKSIYYIKSSKAIKEQIQDKLPELSYKLENVDEDWAQEEIEKVFEETFEDTDVKWKKFAKDMLAKTGILTRYVDRISRSKKFKTFEEFSKQELAQLEIYKGLFKILNLKAKSKADLYTKRNIKKARTRVAKLAKLIEDSYVKGDLSKKEAMELLFLLEQQHITAAKIGNGKWQAIAGKNALTETGESGTQRDQLFGSKEGAALDFRLFINNKLKGGKKGLQLGLDTKENNAIKKKLGITKLFAQKSKNVIESLIKGDFDFKGRKKEALLARKLVKMQINFYSKLYRDGEITAEELAMHVLTFGSNMGTASRRAANVHGIQKGILSNITSGTYIYGLLKNIGKDLEYEHGKPHEQLILELISVGLTKKEKSLVGKDKPMPWESTEMDNVFVDYEVNIITKLMDKTLTASNRKSSMGFGYVKGLAQGWVQRMFNEENFGDPRVGAIVSVDGKNTIYGEGHEKITKVLRKPVSEINKDKKISKGIQSARSINYSEKSKGITILDFDDTLATSKSEVISTAPDGTIRKLTAEEFAKEGADLLDQGWKHDFSEFSKVVAGKVASLFNKALKLQRKFGPENMFVLTARPADSAPAIFEFLKANGLNIPLKNITGLANSTPEAKALWVAEKVGEGYNDFYFADDALQNVQAVDNILSQFDVKRKIQQAKQSKSINYSERFNDILEETKGVGAEKRFSKAKAERRGDGKGDWQIFIPPSADDFIGLIYNFLGKGKKGEQQLEWFKETLLNPLNRAYRELYQAKQAISNDYKQLGKQLPNIRKKLFSKVKDSDFTYNDAIRVYLWEKSGFKIPGLSKTDIKELVSVVENDQDLKTYANAIGIISRSKEGYVAPTENWMVEDIRTDLIHATDTVNRRVFFKEFLENMEIIFSDENLNKIEAIYGKNFREALEDMLYRIEYGTNRSFGSNRLVNRFMNWINGSIGVTMFFNSRSSILQTLSTVNFINWDDNSPIAAAKAFANQKQYWSDFVMIFNSDMLKQRREGKSFDLNSNELANYVSNSKQPVRSAINWLLQKGFLPTQIMDSFAIAAGGATFYRNRLNTYLLQGDSIDVAKQKAFTDFQGIAEQTQQSARQDMISQQQASVLGRLILAFQNTPMQYARLMKKAILDLKNGRGDTKSNISRIVYYGAIQNLIFYSMQTALFAMMFGGEDDDDEKWLEKKERVIHGGLDSLLRGMGVGGAAVSTLKNMIYKFIKEQDKPRNRRDESAILMELLNLSPPIGIKARQIQSGTKTINWNGDTISQIPLYNLNNPVWEAGFNYTQALTNVPLARLHTKVSNIRESLNQENEAWQRIAMFSGWSKWNIGIRDKKRKSKTKKKRSYGRKVKSY